MKNIFFFFRRDRSVIGEAKMKQQCLASSRLFSLCFFPDPLVAMEGDFVCSRHEMDGS